MKRWPLRYLATFSAIATAADQRPPRSERIGLAPACEGTAKFAGGNCDDHCHGHPPGTCRSLLAADTLEIAKHRVEGWSRDPNENPALVVRIRMALDHALMFEQSDPADRS